VSLGARPDQAFTQQTVRRSLSSKPSSWFGCKRKIPALFRARYWTQGTALTLDQATELPASPSDLPC